MYPNLSSLWHINLYDIPQKEGGLTKSLLNMPVKDLYHVMSFLGMWHPEQSSLPPESISTYKVITKGKGSKPCLAEAYKMLGITGHLKNALNLSNQYVRSCLKAFVTAKFLRVVNGGGKKVYTVTSFQDDDIWWTLYSTWFRLVFIHFDSSFITEVSWPWNSVFRATIYLCIFLILSHIDVTFTAGTYLFWWACCAILLSFWVKKAI